MLVQYRDISSQQCNPTINRMITFICHVNMIRITLLKKKLVHEQFNNLNQKSKCFISTELLMQVKYTICGYAQQIAGSLYFKSQKASSAVSYHSATKLRTRQCGGSIYGFCRSSDARRSICEDLRGPFNGCKGDGKEETWMCRCSGFVQQMRKQRRLYFS